MRKPRLIYDNDASHCLKYRYDPPVRVRRLRQPIDEILGTSVDILFNDQALPAVPTSEWLEYDILPSQVRAGANTVTGWFSGCRAVRFAS